MNFFNILIKQGNVRNPNNSSRGNHFLENISLGTFGNHVMFSTALAWPNFGTLFWEIMLGKYFDIPLNIFEIYLQKVTEYPPLK